MINSTNDPIIDCKHENVYSPSDDSFLIVDYFREAITNQSFDGYSIKEIKYILDMGTGTGIIAIFLKLCAGQLANFNPKIYASDILKEAIVCAKRNEKLNKLKGKIHFIQSNLFQSFSKKLRNKFNVIIFNPPYLPALENSREQFFTDIDYSWSGGEKGYETLIEFFNQVITFSNPDHSTTTAIYFITSSRVKIEIIDNAIQKLGFQREEIAKIHIFFEDIILNRAVRLKT